MPGPAARDFVGIVVAAGRASRFGPGPAKQFRQLGDNTLLDLAIGALAAHPAVRGVVVVLAAEELGRDRARALGRDPRVQAVVAGGAERADSVRCGIAAAGDAPFVLVHDAARPLAGAALVARVVEATRRDGAAIPGLPIPDTVKRVARAAGGATGWRVEETVARDALRVAQTPQGSRTDWLRAALDRVAGEPGVTDDAAALERAGFSVTVVAGDPANRKITSPEDLAQARAGLGQGASVGLRVGSGFDVHRFGGPRALMLGGVEFEGHPGLEGHSDADVVLHAAMDAVLGAAAEPDIGVLFPPGDPRFAGADSRVLAAEVACRIGAAGFRIVNLDVTLLAEKPRVGPRVGEIRASIARCFGIPPGRVGVKATTLEGLGALGHGEGAACQAVALLERVARDET